MVELSIKAKIHPKLLPILRDLGPLARRELFSIGGAALASTVRSYLRRTGASQHNTASRLGATPTGHILKGAARVTSFSTADSAIVSVPIAGISRAFHDLTITAKKANNLTIPVAAASYGHRVRELKRMGWTVFTPKGRDFIMGKQAGDKEPTLLYALKKQVVIRKDRSLLPSNAEVTKSINMAIGYSIEQHLRRRSQ
jgi:hypothetical protein